MKPNRERIRTWAKALASGEYQRTEGRLRTDPGERTEFGYCAVGVACKVYEQHTGCALDVIDWDCAGFPRFVADWYGLDRSTCGPKLILPGMPYADSVVALNDNYHAPFGIIAEALLAEYPAKAVSV